MNNSETKLGVVSGISLSILGQIHNDVLQTTMLAALGAIVSYFVSKALQYIDKHKK